MTRALLIEAPHSWHANSLAWLFYAREPECDRWVAPLGTSIPEDLYPAEFIGEVTIDTDNIPTDRPSTGGRTA